MERAESAAYGEKPSPRTGPLGLGGILDLTFNLCREHFWKLVALGAVQWFVVPLVVTLAAVVIAGVFVGGLAVLMKSATVIGFVIVGIIAALVIAAILVASLVGHAAMVYAVSRLYWGGDASIKDSFRYGLSQLGPFAWTSFLFVGIIVCLTVASLAVVALPYVLWTQLVGPTGWDIPLAISWGLVGTTAALTIPSVAMLRLWVVDKVVVVESGSGVPALKRAWRLTSGKAVGPFPRSYAGRLAVLMLLVPLITIAVNLVFEVPAALIAHFIPQDLSIIAAAVKLALNSVSNLVGGLFGTVCGVVFYYDIRIRKEGLDIELLVASAAEQAV
jgi:hypothetical protein